MPFSDAHITCALEQGLRRIPGLHSPRVAQITCEDVYFYGLSANTFARCDAIIVAGDKEKLVKLVIKRWAPGGPTDVDMGVISMPREALAFTSGMFDANSMPPQVDTPFIAALEDTGSDEHWVIMRDVSDALAVFRSSADLTDIHRRYAVVLDRLAMMHATWEKPGNQARLNKLNWLVPDSLRLRRGEAVARYDEGLPLSESRMAQVKSVSDWIQEARIRSARAAFYETLSDADAALWKHHECNRRDLVAAFTAFPTTLVHGDLYSFNIGLPSMEDDDPIILIDWEWIGNGCAALDVAKLLSVGATQMHADFESQGLATYYFERYVAHGGTLFNLTTWQRAYELAEVYHALIVHTLASGWAILDDSPSRALLLARTPRLSGLLASYLS